MATHCSEPLLQFNSRLLSYPTSPLFFCFCALFSATFLLSTSSSFLSFFVLFSSCFSVFCLFSVICLFTVCFLNIVLFIRCFIFFMLFYCIFMFSCFVMVLGSVFGFISALSLSLSADTATIFKWLKKHTELTLNKPNLVVTVFWWGRRWWHVNSWRRWKDPNNTTFHLAHYTYPLSQVITFTVLTIKSGHYFYCINY